MFATHRPVSRIKGVLLALWLPWDWLFLWLGRDAQQPWQMLPCSAGENWRSLTIHLPPPSLDTQGKEFWSGITDRDRFQGPFPHNDDFLKMEPDIKDLCPLPRGFSSQYVDSMWIWLYTCRGKTCSWSLLNHLMLAMISFLKPLESTVDG